MKKKNKTIYETPIIIPLGELARGSGAPPIRVCNPGSGAKDGCGTGNAGPPKLPQSCRNGSAATKKCTSGAGVIP